MTRLSRELVGTWELLSRVDRTSAGEERVEPSLGNDPVALLYYDKGGHFAAQFMKRDRASMAVTDTRAAAANNSRAIGGYDAYFGTYTVDDATGMVTQRLVATLSPESVGMVVTRRMVVEGERLTIEVETTLSGEAVTRTLTWKRVG